MWWWQKRVRPEIESYGERAGYGHADAIRYLIGVVDSDRGVTLAEQMRAIELLGESVGPEALDRLGEVANYKPPVEISGETVRTSERYPCSGSGWTTLTGAVVEFRNAHGPLRKALGRTRVPLYRKEPVGRNLAGPYFSVKRRASEEVDSEIGARLDRIPAYRTLREALVKLHTRQEQLSAEALHA